MDYGHGINFMPGFLGYKDATTLIDWTNDNIDKFIKYEYANNPQRWSMRFGKDEIFLDDSPHIITGIDDIEDLVKSYMEKVTSTIKSHYRYPKDLYVNSFWLSKQLDNAWVEKHNDCDTTHNAQFKFSVICYLNNNKTGGELEFPELGIMIKPTGGSMVVFPSHGEEYLHEVKKIDEDRYSMLFWITDDPEYAIQFDSDESE